MNNRVLVAVIVIIILLAGGFVLFNKNNSVAPSANTKIEEEVTIAYSDAGFASSRAILKNGGKITWINKSSREVKIGADPHPIHTGNREVSGGEFTLDLKPGDQKTVSVSKVGTFGYHNHLNPSDTGEIVVQ
jgi:plastocyanin